ncbi:hypothetical protein [Streptomyces sp. NPDC088258]|uniref:hypothetical protein n=1 Tax=Streptomyces sp. NPDC088258 TaxID=3365849 RepID=UPI00381F249E
MSGGEKPALTDDEARVQIQMSQTEISRISASMAPGASAGGGAGPFGSTSFEGRELNAMIDLVDSANHTDLENAGSALWKARDALKEAARELKGYIDEVEWQGESGAAFKDFGTRLTKHAVSLADFADVAGTQITVAGTGLASVRSSMPARDGRMIKKKVEDIPLPGRIDGNADYTAAVKVEKDRQEAINQMYRLASFYAVSEERLAAQEPPVFEGVLDANVPPPRGRVIDDEVRNSPSTSTLSDTAASRQGGNPGDSIGAMARRSEAVSLPQGTAGVASLDSVAGGVSGAPRPEPLELPDYDASMELNTVAAQQIPVSGSGAQPNSTPSGPTGAPSAAGYPSYGNAPYSLPGGPPRPAGPVGGSVTGQRSVTSPAVGRPGAPDGRAVAPGRPGAAGSVAPGVGRASGVVGGNPRAAGGSSGSRIPRGTVVGGEGVSPGRAVGGRAGQTGVVGANPAKSSVRPGGRAAAGSNGVVGTPRGSASGSRSRGGGFTQGGAGLVRGPGRSGSEKDEQEPTESSRPDYLTEDEETWTGRRRGAVPPVVE